MSKFLDDAAKFESIVEAMAALEEKLRENPTDKETLLRYDECRWNLEVVRRSIEKQMDGDQQKVHGFWQDLCNGKV